MLVTVSVVAIGVQAEVDVVKRVELLHLVVEYGATELTAPVSRRLDINSALMVLTKESKTI